MVGKCKHMIVKDLFLFVSSIFIHLSFCFIFCLSFLSLCLVKPQHYRFVFDGITNSNRWRVFTVSEQIHVKHHQTGCNVFHSTNLIVILSISFTIFEHPSVALWITVLVLMSSWIFLRILIFTPGCFVTIFYCCICFHLKWVFVIFG